ncbi:MAG: hypothetical protein ACLGGU_06630, partial [Gammaproteobacteria bacterium]
ELERVLHGSRGYHDWYVSDVPAGGIPFGHFVLHRRLARGGMALVSTHHEVRVTEVNIIRLELY